MKDFFALDNGNTREALDALVWTYPKLECATYKADQWRSNPLHQIAKDEDMWAGYVTAWKNASGKKLNLTDWFRSLAICQGYVLNVIGGPEGDGQPQMLRKHWYAWGKLGLQQPAIRLETALQENGEPDSEKLNALMSVVFGKWNADNLVEYRDFYILNDSSKMVIFPNSNPSANILICCEKDAAFQGVALSGAAMGAIAVYSGGGKSSRSGIEKLYYNCLKDRLRYGGDLVVLVISDYDMDGEAVIAPTFAEQLATYVDKDRIKWVRVGVTPEQVENLRGEWDAASYTVKWDVNSMIHYYRWCQDKSIVRFECLDCGLEAYTIGTKCPSCHSDQILVLAEQDANLSFWYPEDIDDLDDKDEIAEIKECFKRFFTEHSPQGFELDALTRIEYCQILVDGLLEIVDWDDLVAAWSDDQNPNSTSVAYDLQRVLLEGNESYRELQAYQNKLREWFNTQTEGLRALQQNIEREMLEKANALVGMTSKDYVFEQEDYPESDQLVGYMQEAKAKEGRCSLCYCPISECSSPDRHKDQGYHHPGPATIEEQLADVAAWNPFDRYDREARWLSHVQEVVASGIEQAQAQEWKFDKLDIGDDD